MRIGRIMIRSGGFFYFKSMCGIIGAVIEKNGTRYIVTASHFFHKADMGNHIRIECGEGVVKRFVDDYDLALIEMPGKCMYEITALGKAMVLEDAFLKNDKHTVPCRVIRPGLSLLSLLFPCFDMPQPGDSGSPIFQDGRVIGILSSVIFSNCTGTAVSANVLSEI